MSLRFLLPGPWRMLQHEMPGVAGYLILSIISILFFWVARRMYRYYYHPLKQFKGLPEACVSDHWLYKTTKDGNAEEIFEDLHEKYSQFKKLPFKIFNITCVVKLIMSLHILDTKALRIGPNELHLTDINLYKVIYSQTKPFLNFSILRWFQHASYRVCRNRS